MSLADKIRKARQSVVEAGGFKFTIRRPTDLEMLDIQQGQKITQAEIFRNFVIGWEGVNEIDLVPGGTATSVPFESGLFMEWIADRPDLWATLVNAVIGGYRQHEQALEESLKNSRGG